MLDVFVVKLPHGIRGEHSIVLPTHIKGVAHGVEEGEVQLELLMKNSNMNVV